jgi:3-hydroxyisobutyrate dehydrogenase-like beta-hydroxyacid dehydrogenase
MPREKLGFVGLGIMGMPMAGHLLQAGHPLTVFNRTRSRAEEIGRQGAVVAGSLADVASSSDIVFVMVSDTPDVEQVVAGPGGLVEGLRSGSVVVDMSTVSPELERRLEELLRAKGCALLDAPVSGGDVGARNATLAIMVGGAGDAFERVLLLPTQATITHCGPFGGQLTKLCNQIVAAGNLPAAIARWFPQERL